MDSWRRLKFSELQGAGELLILGRTSGWRESACISPKPPCCGRQPAFLLEAGATRHLLPCVGSTLLLACPLLPEGEGFVLFGKAVKERQNGAIWVWFIQVECWSGGN